MENFIELSKFHPNFIWFSNYIRAFDISPHHQFRKACDPVQAFKVLENGMSVARLH